MTNAEGTRQRGDHPIEPPDRTSRTPSVYPPTGGPIDHIVTSGTFSLDGGTWDVDNNVWIVGDANEVIVIGGAHDVEKIALGIGGRRVVAVLCTHAHHDHVNRAPALLDQFNEPVLLHPPEAPLWEMTHLQHPPDRELTDGDTLRAGGIELRVLLTPRALPRLVVPLHAGAGHSRYPCSSAVRARRGGRTRRSI